MLVNIGIKYSLHIVDVTKVIVEDKKNRNFVFWKINTNFYSLKSKQC